MTILMSNELNVHEFAFRPSNNRFTRVHKQSKAVQFFRNGIWRNSALRKDEWEDLDAIVLEAAGPRTEILAGIPKKRHATMGTLTSQYNTISQMDPAQVTMTGRSAGQLDQAEYSLVGVPLPVIFKDVSYGARELMASRMLGDGIEGSQVFEATRVVTEEVANMLYLGKSAINFNGDTIYGLASHPNRNTGSASGDFGTISNIMPTILAMVGVLVGDGYHGPYALDVAATQHTEMMAVYTDGSGQSAITRALESIPALQEVNSNDQLTAGHLVLRQMGRNITEWAQVDLGGQTINDVQIALVEWMSGDGFVHHFKVMHIGAPLVKADYEAQSGIAHYTGA